MASSGARIAAAGCVALSGCHAITGLDDMYLRSESAASTGSTTVSGTGGAGDAGGMGGLGAAGGGGGGGAGGSPCLADAALTYRETVLCDHPLAYWRLDEANPTEAIDEVGNAHPGMYRNSAKTGAVGVAGSTAAEFHTSGSAYIEIGNFFDFSGQEHFSIEAWVKPSSTMPEQTGIVSKFDGVAKQGYSLGIQPNGMTATRAHDSMDIATVTVGLPPTDAFTHVVVTYDGDTIRLYKNGEFKGIASKQTLVETDNALTIGSFGGWGFFDGLIDEVAIYGARLLDSRIEAHYAAGIAQ